MDGFRVFCLELLFNIFCVHEKHNGLVTDAYWLYHKFEL